MSTENDFALLSEFTRQEMDRLQVPGVSVGIHHESQDYTAGFGITNVTHPLPVTEDTLFQIGSTSKTVCATVAMRLVEQGTLDLDTPIRAYLPGLTLADQSVAANVTLRHLFNHTGGWEGDYFESTGAGDDALEKMTARLVGLAQLTPLGEVFSYNNAGFYLAGRVIETATGKPYETVARELVLEPLGMSRSFFFAREVITDRVAVGHRVGDNGPEVQRDWELPRAANAAGGIISTPGDQLRYACFHMGDGTTAGGTRLLSQESLSLMQTATAPAGNGITALGVTWMLRDIGGTRVVQHGGATNGQLSAFQMVPSRRFAITVLTNADKGGELHRNVTNWALKQYLGVEEPKPLVVEISAEALREFVGRYASLGNDLEISLKDGGLEGQIIPKGGFPTKDSPPPPTPPPFAIGFLDQGNLLVTDGPLKDMAIDVLRGRDKQVAYVRAGFRILKKAQ
ncbi:MAG TPA: serine hydrolase domain-containing protein [Chloroflexota bacterium]